MGDMDRQAVLRQVHRNLTNPEFGRRFTAQSDDGSKPIVVALRDDTITSLAKQVRATGGIANVVTPFMNTLLVYVLRSNAKTYTGAKKITGKTLDNECTVGLLISRALGESSEHFSYDFYVDDDEWDDSPPSAVVFTSSTAK